MDEALKSDKDRTDPEEQCEPYIFVEHVFSYGSDHNRSNLIYVPKSFLFKNF